MPSKDEIITELQNYNKVLLSKLDHAREWMKRSVDEKQEESYFLKKRSIEKNIEVFLGKSLSENIKSDIIDDLISSELMFQTMNQDPSLDGSSILIGYNKALDILIEEKIVKSWRIYAEGKSTNIIKSEHPLERLLYQTVYKHYTLSIGKLYGLLKEVSQENSGFFRGLFSDFLNSNSDISRILFDQDFIEKVALLVEKDYFGSKRHSANIELSEAEEVRRLVMGDFKERSCIFYQLLTI